MRRRLLSGALGLASLALAGCGTTSAANQSVTITGRNLTVYISAPAGYGTDPALADTVAAEQLAFAQHSSEVTSFAVHLRLITASKLSDDARTAIRDTKAIAYLGELQPGASEQSAGITNAQDLLQVSPTDTAVELTDGTPAIANTPKRYLESTKTYGHTFGRIAPSSAVEAKAQVAEMQSLGVKTLYVADDGSDYGRAIAAAVHEAAAAASISVAASDASADATFFGGVSAAAAARTFTGAAGSSAGAKLFAPSALATPAFVAALGGGVTHRVYVSVPGEPAAQLPAAAQTFAADFKARFGHAPGGQAIYGYEAMAAVLDAIHLAGRNAGDRAQVVRDFMRIKNRAASVLGPYSITAGDSSLTGFAFETAKAGRLVAIAPVKG